MITTLGWLMVGGMGFVMASKSIRRWTGPGGEVEEIHGSHLPEIIGGGAMVALSCYFLGVGLGIGGGSVKTSGSQTGAFDYQPPNAPNGMDVIVDDTSTWRVLFPAFVGSGDDTQDSIAVTVLRSGAADTLFHAVSGTQTADTISDNTDLKADTTYRVLGRQKGVNGGWSNADTVSVVNVVGVYVFALQFDSTTASSGSSDWFALLDSTNTTPFTARVYNGRASAVVTAASLGLSSEWPTTNALRSSHDWTDENGPAENIGFTVQDSLFAVPDSGGSIYYRWYYRNIFPDTVMSDTNAHPIEDGTTAAGWSISGITWAFRISYNAVDTWEADFRCGGAAASGLNAANNGLWNGPTLAKDSTYRFELQAEMMSATTFRCHIRIYSYAGVLQYDDGDFVCANTACTGIGVVLDTNPILYCNTARSTNCNSLTGFQAGHNGGFGATPPASGADQDFALEGAFCIRTDDWCGAYNATAEAGGP